MTRCLREGGGHQAAHPSHKPQADAGTEDYVAWQNSGTGGTQGEGVVARRGQIR